MEGKKKPGGRVGAFLTGKGYYIVLFLCVAVVGLSAWAILPGIGTDVESEEAAPAAEYTVNVSAAPTWSIPEATDNMGVEPPEVKDTMEESAEVWSENENAEPVFEEPQPPVYIWPLYGETETPYSMEELVYSYTMADWRVHDGIDIAADLGAQVSAAGSGTVERVYTDDMLGTTVIIDHGGGLRSVYANLAETPTVAEGDSVTVGDVIGAVGRTALIENGAPPHLHFTMTLDGVTVDPAQYLPQ